MDDLVTLGLGDGLELQIAAARLARARDLGLFAGAGRDPTLGVSVDANRGNLNASAGKRSVTLQGSLNVDLWGAADARSHSAGMTAEASAFDLATLRQMLAA